MLLFAMPLRVVTTAPSEKKEINLCERRAEKKKIIIFSSDDLQSRTKHTKHHTHIARRPFFPSLCKIATLENFIFVFDSHTLRIESNDDGKREKNF